MIHYIARGGLSSAIYSTLEVTFVRSFFFFFAPSASNTTEAKNNSKITENCILLIDYLKASITRDHETRGGRAGTD